MTMEIVNESLSDQRNSYINNNKVRFLLLDDDQDHIFLLKYLIDQNTNAEVVTFEKPEEALNYLKNGEDLKDSTKGISLIISDFNMFPINGMNFYKELQKMRISIPFILISSFVSKKMIIDAKKAGIKNCISKNQFFNHNYEKTIKSLFHYLE
ncbi:MAG: Transcriptional regulatory protein ZraR [Candidatus Heimdallarchaeota archaeon LC_3]|nr:MAG: Transcriptional regulatory protein ZraR [Candidatus Heimdallarchaeota archaeon LC_3]